MQDVAAEISGCAGQSRCFLGRRAQFVLIQFILKQAFKQNAQRPFKSFLTRNELVASTFA